MKKLIIYFTFFATIAEAQSNFQLLTDSERIFSIYFLLNFGVLKSTTDGFSF